MQHMVVVGKADELPVRAKNVNVAAATQRPRRVRRGDIHRIKIAHLAVVRNHSLTMVKIILPVCIRFFRAVDKNIFVLRRMSGHHADMRAVSRMVDHLNLARNDIDPLNGFTGKRRAGRADIIDKPLAVWRPDVDVGELVVAGSEGDLFHENTLMRGYRIRVKHPKGLAYSFHVTYQQRYTPEPDQSRSPAPGNR